MIRAPTRLGKSGSMETMTGNVTASSPAALRRMKAAKRRDTGPELRLRRELHRRGLRYRVDYPVLPRRRGDIVFTALRVAVFVDGCWWHSCPDHGTKAKANAGFWEAKLEANRQRDLDTTAALSADGWHVVRIWEHEDAAIAVWKVVDAVAAARADRNIGE